MIKLFLLPDKIVESHGGNTHGFQTVVPSICSKSLSLVAILSIVFIFMIAACTASDMRSPYFLESRTAIFRASSSMLKIVMGYFFMVYL